MSSDNTAHDTMRRYETNQDSGDASNDPQPAVEPAPGNLGNDDSDNPIPMATPQSPVQTEHSPEIVNNKENEDTSGTDTDRVYREAKDGNL